jgi:hypothetical protein
LSEAALEAFVVDIRHLNLVVVRGGGPSPYFPGQTQLLRVMLKGITGHLTTSALVYGDNPSVH